MAEFTFVPHTCQRHRKRSACSLIQTEFADSRIIVTVSDKHIRDALDIPLKGAGYALKVGNTLRYLG